MTKIIGIILFTILEVCIVTNWIELEMNWIFTTPCWLGIIIIIIIVNNTCCLGIIIIVILQSREVKFCFQGRTDFGKAWGEARII